ncbi:hypothetical protein C1X59_08475 [Pseudomonas sp. FW215-R2]|uniref:hypothetical protein n=1 Tax=unclassified Pseudomonas TaxID=196821 RepID=UPI000C8826B6|nr:MULTISPECIES: hypothetical protein [unclassified Pseudomonas]PMX02346.1 hypothetical protein C1X59_08475 [Pseudomonas sp. FW215-R2]PMX11032.1 hypothetical protein C1X60_07765 [Pseudomonas sp. FW215-L1]PMX20783.1 hypothetical protein C1X57_19795 [Pseudomonas sp. FW215-E1]PNA21740.1 hypothetical protein C1X58_28155 [Pseudomonas sp. FW215-R4]
MPMHIRQPKTLNIANHSLVDCQNLLSGISIVDLVICFDDETPFDIGALCYSIRKKAIRSLVKQVDISSLRPGREKAFRELVVEKITEIKVGRTRPKSATTTLRELSAFTDWSDATNHENCFESPPDYHRALYEYSQNLNKRLEKHEFKQFTANRLQAFVINNATTFFPDAIYNFTAHIPPISSQGHIKNKTKVPELKKYVTNLTLCDYIFDGFTDFLLKQELFPYQMPFQREHIWLLPAQYPFVTQKILSLKKRYIEECIFWNYAKGEVRPLDECMERANQAPHQVRRQRQETLDLLTASNNQTHHPARVRLAKWAHDSFVYLFVANTAMNETPVRDLLWSEKYTISKDRHGFRTIKWRAHGLPVEFEILSSFVPTFEKFLKLRKYIVRDALHPYLFIGMSSNPSKQITRLQPSTIQHINTQIANFIDPGHEPLNYRELRLYKSSYLLSKKHKISTVANVLQTSETSVRNSYTEAEEKQAIDEIASFFSVLTDRANVFIDSATPAGGCSSPDKPSTKKTPPEGYEPNCKNLEGCIFCDEFRTNTEPKQIRKLVSMKYTIGELISSCNSAQHFNEVHGLAIQRIDQHLDEISATSPAASDDVEKITREVYEENQLSDYWQKQLDRYIKIGVIK